MQDDLDDELLGVFLEELEEHLQALNTAMLALESSGQGEPAADHVRAAFRAAHNLKGACMVSGLSELEDVCHHLESNMQAFREGRLSLSAADMAAAVLPVLDALQEAGNRYSASGPKNLPAVGELFVGLRGAKPIDPSGNILEAADQLFDELQNTLAAWTNRWSQSQSSASASLSLRQEEILSLVEHCLHRLRHQRAEPEGQPEEPSIGTPRILVVDDSRTMRTSQKRLLTSAGYDVHVASDGNEAWKMLREAPFDLVVSDVEMPSLDGFGLTDLIRQSRVLSRMPVILLTALADDENRQRGLSAGADEYLEKARGGHKVLLETVERLLSQSPDGQQA